MLLLLFSFIIVFFSFESFLFPYWAVFPNGAFGFLASGSPSWGLQSGGRNKNGLLTNMMLPFVLGILRGSLTIYGRPLDITGKFLDKILWPGAPHYHILQP